MKRWQRRLWIAGVGLGASLVILLGLLVGAFRIAVQLVPDYRADVETEVSRLLQTPARIQDMNLIWRGRYPTLQLHQVALGETAQGLQFRELRIGFSLWRLLQGDLMPRAIQMRGTALELRLSGGELQLAGLKSNGASRQAPESLLDQLYAIGRIELVDARLLWLDLDHQRPPRELLISEMDLRRSFRGMEFDMAGRVRDQGELRVSALLQQKPWRLDRLSLELAGLDLWQDLQALAPQLPALQGRINELRLDSEWRDGRWESAEVAFDLADFGPAAAPAGFRRWRGELVLNALGPGLRAELHSTELGAASGRWPETLSSVEWQPAAQGAADISVSAEYLRLHDLLPWVALLPEAPRLAWQRMQPAGELRDLLLQLDAGDSWPRVTAELEQVQVSAHEAMPGLRGFSGILTLGPQGGRLQLDSQDLILDAPRLFADPLPLDALSGSLSWKRGVDGWQISAPVLHYAAMNLDGVGRLNLNLGESDAIDLELNFFCTDPGPWLEYQPRFWHENLRGWLSRAIGNANVSNGQVVIRGALGDFPFDEGREGEFRVALELQQTALKFAPDWPRLDIGIAQLEIDGNALTVQASDSRIGRLEAGRAQARIEDLREAVLTVDADISGNAADAWKMLGESKLRRRIGPVLDSLALSGKTQARLKLSLPLKALDETDYQIKARFDRAALWTRHWPDPIQKISGEVDIGPAGLRSHDLTAAIAGIPLRARMTPQDGLTRIEAEMDLSPAELPPSVPVGDWLRKRTEGRSRWRFSMEVGGKADPRLRFESNLLGTALDLPAPLGKPADQLRRLSLNLHPGDETRLHLAYAQLLSLDALIEAGHGLRAARVHFGPDALPAGAPGWWVEGQLGQAALDEWLPLIRDLTAEAGPSSGMPFGGMVLRVGEIQALGQRLNQARLQLSRDEQTWVLGLSSSQAEGNLRIPPVAEGARMRLDGKFSRLNWALEQEDGGELPDPRELPELHLTADRFLLNDVALGRLNLDLTPVSRGSRIERLTVYDKERKEADLTGLWLHGQDGESAALEFLVDTRAFPAWLKALNYQDNIDARRGRVNGSLNWEADPEGLRAARLNGELEFEFSDGQLLNVEPGAGRVLGLFSINALPRRFFLDFRDVVNSGLGFDSLRGSFSIENGAASTRDFELKGTSLRIAARGEVDLAQRSYDQTITIYPGLSSGVSLAATLLGGPVLGIFTMLAQELLDKPLDQVTQISYHLGGSWDSPEVSRTQ